MRSLTFKITLAFLLVSLTGIAIVAILVAGITSSEFNRFTQDKALADYTSAATSYYQSKGSWDGVQESFQEQGLVQAFGQQNSGNPPPPPFALIDSNNQVIISVGPFHHGDQLGSNVNFQKQAITVNNKIVGYVIVTGGHQTPDPLEARFLTRTNQALIFAALGAAALAVLLGLFLARTITRPVRDLTAASTAMAKGQFKQQVLVRSNDEVGELTRSFNKMSADLEHASHLRQQMTADIAHDLRTPLSVITGYLEGLKDGVIKPSPKRFVAMYDEALYLQRLVEDLRTLSLADAGELSMNRQPIQPSDLIERVASSFQIQAEQSNIRIEKMVDENLPLLSLDPERMQQVLSNLVINALRFTPENGEIMLAAAFEDGKVKFAVRDSGAGIDTEVLPHIFERFYRGDSSRSESGSGLGLAIAKSIVELQGGEISATSDGPGTGSQFSIRFPAGLDAGA